MPSNNWIRLSAPFAAAALFAGLLGACGDDDDGSDVTGAETTVASTGTASGSASTTPPASGTTAAATSAPAGERVAVLDFFDEETTFDLSRGNCNVSGDELDVIGQEGSTVLNIQGTPSAALIGIARSTEPGIGNWLADGVEVTINGSVLEYSGPVSDTFQNSVDINLRVSC
jgi:hypothetical protein